MAMAARYERGLLDPDAPQGASIFDHNIWVLCSDGDLQEGVSAEASSLAGTQELGNLKVIYDDNRISIEGDTHISFTEDVSARYKAYGWEVLEVATLPTGDVDRPALEVAIQKAIAQRTKPTLIRLKTVIAWPAPNAQGTYKSHGSALGVAEIAETKKILGLNPEEHFAMPKAILAHVREVKSRGAILRKEWNIEFATWEKIILSEHNYSSDCALDPYLKTGKILCQFFQPIKKSPPAKHQEMSFRNCQKFYLRCGVALLI